MNGKSLIISNGFCEAELRKVVKTERFVWHITYRDKLEDHSISREGLWCPEGGAVYAHSKLRKFLDMYPYVLDSWEFDWHARLPMEGAQYYWYSYWRIDTRIASVTWFWDPFMGNDAPVHGVDPRIFICTPNPIPPQALRLYHFDIDRFLKPMVRVNYGDGVAHVGGDRGDFEGLFPHVT